MMTLWDRSQKDKALTHAYVTLFLMWWTALLTARAVCGDFVNSPVLNNKIINHLSLSA
jgi:hypothetical protein